MSRAIRRWLFLLLCLGSARPCLAEDVWVSPSDPLLPYSGRRSTDADGAVRFSYSGARVRIAFRGTSLRMRMDSERPGNFVNLYLNGERVRKLPIGEAGETMLLAEGLDPGVLHTVEVTKATEGFIGACVFRGFVLPEGSIVEAWPRPETRRILFIGDSITCGYGIEAEGSHIPFRVEDENFDLGFAGRTARALAADYHAVARSGMGLYRNYGGPREGSPQVMAGVFDRTHFRTPDPAWDHAQFQPDVICINLGTNDYSTEGGDEDRFEEAGVAFVKRIRELHPDAKIVLLSGPMQNGPGLRERLQRIRERVEPGESSPISLFALSPQGSLGYGADWHPSARQAERNAEELVDYLSTLMQWTK